MNAFSWDQAKGNVLSPDRSFRRSLGRGAAILVAGGCALLWTAPVNAQVSAPRMLYVDAHYRGQEGPVGFPSGNPDKVHSIGWDAFSTIQGAVNGAPEGGIVYIAPGTYCENVAIRKSLMLVGPNAGVGGACSERQPEARIIPATSDPENSPILSVEADGVVIDGLCLDGANPGLAGGYDANGVQVHAAAGVQNGVYPALADVQGITIRNCIITNISYDGICLDRYLYFGTPSGWNYIRNNLLANMWEGILTYALDSVISGNVISNVTHGLGVHCVNTRAPKGFQPLVTSNLLTIAQWWPVEIEPSRAPGIWINYRREEASPIEVVGNVVATPQPPPAFKTIIGLYALTVDGRGKISFRDNTVRGLGNCSIGLLAAKCWSNAAVKVLDCSFDNIRDTGILADSLDMKWESGNCFLSLSNVAVALSPGGIGVMALQQPATPDNSVAIELRGNSRVSGGGCGVQIRGTNASASLCGCGQVLSGNELGIQVEGGRALLEGNILTNNSRAGLWVAAGGIVDAGDCSGANVSGLGTGSGPGGSSAGGNDFSGYRSAPGSGWAITNSGPGPVWADRNLFRPGPGLALSDVIAGPVNFFVSGGSVVAPPPLEVECFGQVPPPAQTLEQFRNAGGQATDFSALVSACDTVLTNRPGLYTITRRYTISGGCGPEASCTQMITARDNQAPTLHCSANIVQAADDGCDYATVTFTNLAADACGELLGSWKPVSSGQFPVGTNTVIVIATDLANNSAACSFDVAVVAPPRILFQPESRTNAAGTRASFRVLATTVAPVSFRWKRNDSVLADGGLVSGATSAELVLDCVSALDSADYSVEVSNFAGICNSAKAHLSVVSPNGNLRLVEVLADQARLAVTGPAGYEFSLWTSTNLLDWQSLYTNTAPFPFRHTNATRLGSRFYRALRSP